MPLFNNALRQAFNRYHAAIRDVINANQDEANESLDALALENQTDKDIENTALERLTDHESATNPHNTSIADLGGVTRQFINNRLQGGLDTSSLLISQFGDASDNVISTSSSGWVFSIDEIVPCMVMGVFNNLPPISVDLRTLSNNYTQTEFLIYIRLNDSDLEYHISTDLLPETDMIMYVGYIETGMQGISRVKLDKVSRLGIYRIASTPGGATIPVTEGQYPTPTTLDDGFTPNRVQGLDLEIE